MGGLSRKRKQPRIVKKVRRATQMKGVNTMNLPPEIRDNWDKNKTVAENFAELGLSLNMHPRMLQSKEGSKLTDTATALLNPNFFRQRKRPLQQAVQQMEEEDAEPKQPQGPKDLTKLFPKIRPASESIIEPTGKKLKHDEKQIMAKLIKKYGEENHTKMAKDLKINYLQWSKGQCAQNVKIYNDLKEKDML